MAYLVGLAGLSGAGKTTAINHLVGLGAGRRVYLGQIVLDEVQKRRLLRVPENERAVRLALRAELGSDILAKRATPDINGMLANGVNVLVDAIFEFEEYKYLQAHCKNATVTLLAIDASFETRAQRVGSRAERQLTQTELKDRDQTERANLRTDSVMKIAGHTIVNEGPLSAFKRDVEAFWTQLVSSPD